MFGEVCIIFGFVLFGMKVIGLYVYFGCYYLQVFVFCEGCDKELFGWVMLGKNKFFVICFFFGYLFKG